MVKFCFFFFLKVKPVVLHAESQQLMFNFNAEKKMSKDQKKVKGSAYVADDGGFVFTPYRSLPEGDKPMTRVFSTRNGVLWRGKSSYHVRFSWRHDAQMPLTVIVAQLMRMFDYMNKEEGRL